MKALAGQEGHGDKGGSTGQMPARGELASGRARLRARGLADMNNHGQSRSTAGEPPLALPQTAHPK